MEHTSFPLLEPLLAATDPEVSDMALHSSAHHHGGHGGRGHGLRISLHTLGNDGRLRPPLPRDHRILLHHTRGPLHLSSHIYPSHTDDHLRLPNHICPERSEDARATLSGSVLEDTTAEECTWLDQVQVKISLSLDLCSRQSKSIHYHVKDMMADGTVCDSHKAEVSSTTIHGFRPG